MVYRVFVEKKPGLDNEARSLCAEAANLLGVRNLQKVRILNRYDAEGISRELFDAAVPTVFSEPQVDIATEEADLSDACAVFAVEYLPGQFDQRADSARILFVQSIHLSNIYPFIHKYSFFINALSHASGIRQRLRLLTANAAIRLRRGSAY